MRRNKTKLVYSILLLVIIIWMFMISRSSQNHKHSTIQPDILADSLITEVCDTLSREWFLDQKQVNIKNSHRKDSIRIDYTWDQDSKKWHYFQKVCFDYDRSGNLITQTYYSYQANQQKWLYSNKLETSFKKGIKDSETTFNWDVQHNTWIAFLKTKFSYDQSGKDSLESFYIYRVNAKTWEQSCKIENRYDLSGNKKIRMDYAINKKTGRWEYLCKYEYQYDQANLLTIQKYYYWHPDSRKWGNYSVVENKYKQNHISEIKHHQWLMSEKKWFLDNRTKYYGSSK